MRVPSTAIVLGLASIFAVACGGEPAVTGPAPPSTAAPSTTTPGTPTPITPTPAAPTLPEAPPVDLLHAVATELAVSSAYRDRGSSEIPKLFDGDLETAWNSSSGDLVGAWIEVRIPASASVTSIELTAGYTHTSDDADLFTGNHRVSRVRVTRDETEVGSYPLDGDARTLQSLPVTGPGGVYRIELAELAPGSRTDWREACISELRVMGRAADATPSARFPRFATATLPPVLAPALVDREAFARALEHRVFDLRDHWGEYERNVLLDTFETGEPGITPDARSDYEHTRQSHLTHVLETVQEALPAEADALRAAIARHTALEGDGRNWWTVNGADLDLIASVMEAGADFLDDEAARCRWTKVHAGLRLSRVVFLVDLERQYDDMDEMMADGARGADLVEIAADLEDLSALWPRDSETATRRLLRLEAPDAEAARADWYVLHTLLERAMAQCWPAAASGAAAPASE